LSAVHEGRTYEGIFRSPDFDVMCKAQKHLFNQELLDAGMIYYLECKLAAEEETWTTDEVKFAFCLQLATLFKLQVAEIKNL
jgi:hypothetical protein